MEWLHENVTVSEDTFELRELLHAYLKRDVYGMKSVCSKFFGEVNSLFDSNIEMYCIEKQRRPSWKEVFERRIYADPAIYSPMLHIFNTGFPAFPHEPYG